MTPAELSSLPQSDRTQEHVLEIVCLMFILHAKFTWKLIRLDCKLLIHGVTNDAAKIRIFIHSELIKPSVHFLYCNNKCIIVQVNLKPYGY